MPPPPVGARRDSRPALRVFPDRLPRSSFRSSAGRARNRNLGPAACSGHRTGRLQRYRCITGCSPSCGDAAPGGRNTGIMFRPARPACCCCRSITGHGGPGRRSRAGGPGGVGNVDRSFPGAGRVRASPPSTAPCSASVSGTSASVHCGLRFTTKIRLSSFSQDARSC